MEPLNLPIVTTTVITVALIYLCQTVSVIRIRRRERIIHGDGGNKTAMKRIRGHANMSEQAPLFLILLALCEIQGFGTPLILSIMALLFVVGRLSHAYYFLDIGGHFRFRQFGMVGTLLSGNILLITAIIGLLF